MATLEELRGQLPDQAKDIKLNLQSVLQTSELNKAQKWGVAVASAIARPARSRVEVSARRPARAKRSSSATSAPPAPNAAMINGSVTAIQ